MERVVTPAKSASCGIDTSGFRLTAFRIFTDVSGELFGELPSGAFSSLKPALNEGLPNDAFKGKISNLI